MYQVPHSCTATCLSFQPPFTDGALNEYALSRNCRPAKEITGTLLPRFPHVPASDAQLTTWLSMTSSAHRSHRGQQSGLGPPLPPRPTYSPSLGPIYHEGQLI